MIGASPAIPAGPLPAMDRADPGSTALRYLRLLGLYVHQHVLDALSWRGFMLTLVVNQAVTPLLGLAVWSAALPGSRAVSAYYVALLAVQFMTVCYENVTFTQHITSGALADRLLRPHPVVLYVLGGNCAWRIWHLLFGLPLVVGTALAAGVAFQPATVTVAIPAVVLAAALRFLFTYVLALTAIWIQRAGSVINFGNTLVFLLGGAAAPVALFPDRLRPLGEALPFRAMHGFPAEIAAGSLGHAQIAAGYAWQLLWTTLFTLIAIAVWRAGVRRYTAVGG